MPKKPRLHKQETKYSCAPACLLMVLDALGVSKTETEIREDSKCTRLLETNHDDLVDAAKKYGFRDSDSFYLSFNQLREQLHQGHFPIVYVGVTLYPDTRTQLHSVVVTAINRQGVRVLDPIRGEIVIPRRVFEEQHEYMRRVTILIK